MSIKIKPLLYIFIAVLILFSLIGLLLNKTVLPAQDKKVFDQLQNSIVSVPDDLDKDKKKIYFTVNEQTNLPVAVQELNKVLENSEYEDYNLAVHSDEESDALLEAWYGMQYNVYEIMGQKRFSDIPQLAAQISEQYPHILSSISMNEHYVLITLNDGQNQLYRMLPIQTTTMEAWG